MPSLLISNLRVLVVLCLAFLFPESSRLQLLPAVPAVRQAAEQRVELTAFVRRSCKLGKKRSSPITVKYQNLEVGELVSVCSACLWLGTGNWEHPAALSLVVAMEGLSGCTAAMGALSVLPEKTKVISSR